MDCEDIAKVYERKCLSSIGAATTLFWAGALGLTWFGFEDRFIEFAIVESAAALAVSIAVRRRFQTLSRWVHRGFQNASESEAKAWETQKEKANFLRELNHEMRTAMTSVIGMADLLSHTRLDPKQREFVATLSRVSDSMRGTLARVADLFRIESGSLAIESKPFDLPDVLESLLQKLRSEAHGRNLDLRLVWKGPNDARCLGDADRLASALGAVLESSIRSRRNGRISLLVSPIDGRSKEPRYLFQFSEAAETHRGDETVETEKDAGNLSFRIARQFVEVLGGRIWSEDDSTFSFTLRLAKVSDGTKVPAAIELRPELLKLPFEVTAAAIERPKTVVPLAPTPPVAAAGPLRVLIVDDHADNRALIGYYLEDERLQLDIAENGAEAILMATRSAYDLILMDLQMPLMDGMQATREIRKMEEELRRSPSCVAALTAQTYPEDVEGALASGCNLHIPKPVNRAEILALVQRVRARAVPHVVTVALTA